MHRTRLSIVTPSYNQARFVRRTIESVLSQDVPGLEHLVFDGGSTDDTPSILGDYAGRLTAVIEPDAGQADAVNKGFGRASGDVIGWLNSDDVYYPGACLRVLEVFEARPDVQVVYGAANHIDEDDRILEPYPTETFNYERLKETCFLCQPAVFFRRAVVDKYGPLDVKLRYCMDYEYWLRILADKAPCFLPATLAGSRLHAETKTLGSAEAVHREILEMQRAKFGAPHPTWVIALAHVIVRARGLTRDTPREDARFVGAIVETAEEAFARYCGRVPASEVKRLSAWRAHARRAMEP